jgi:hypothetical protein
MNRNFRVIAVSVAFCAIVVTAVVAFTIRQSMPGPPAGDVLTSRLVKLGVPIQSVVVTSQSPLRVTIIITTDRTQDKVSDVNLWNVWLVKRVATLSYLNGLPIASYRVIEVNPKGEQTSSGEGFLNPSIPSQQLKVGEVLSPVDDAATRDWLAKHLDTQGLPITALTVTSGIVVRPNEQFVELHLTATSLQGANKVLSPLIISLHKSLDTANQNGGTRIVVLRLKVFDADWTLLLHYVSDFEAGMDVFSYADGVDASWYPEPANTPTVISPLNSPIPPP